MKKLIIVLAVFVLVLTAAGFTGDNPVWASLLPAGWQPAEEQEEAYAPPLKKINVTADGIYNVGGVCTVTIDFLKENLQIDVDSEAPNKEVRLAYYPGDGNLLYPGCHVVNIKEGQTIDQMPSDDATNKICFGASSNMIMQIWYYLDSTPIESRVWKQIPAWLEDQGRLICASAPYTGVYMPVGKIIPRPPADQPGGSVFYPGGLEGSVVTPPSKITITQSGAYPVGGVCLLRADYYIRGLSDTVEVEYPPRHYTEETLTVPSDAVTGLFYYPGCHVIHYKDNIIQTQMFKEQGSWEICFAAIPGKTMTIYYYRDDLTTIVAPWVPLESTTENGMVCAPLVDFSAVYVPGGE